MLKYFRQSLIFRRIFSTFFLTSICIVISAGYFNYQNRKQYILDDINKEVTSQLTLAVDYFDNVYSAPITSDLQVLANSPTLDNFLTAQQNEIYLIRPTIEKMFLHFTKEKADQYFSARFIDRTGMERIITRGNRRIKRYRSVNDRALSPLDAHTQRLYSRLKNSNSTAFQIEGPFLHENQYGFLIGRAVSEPEIRNFGGVVMFHCRLETLLAYLSQLQYRGFPIAYAYDVQGKLLSNYRTDNLLDPYSGKALVSAAFDTFTNLSMSEIGYPLLRLRIFVPSMVSDQANQDAFDRFTIVMFILMLVIGIVAFLLSKKITAPIRELLRGTKKISEGDLSVEFKKVSNDEIGELTDSFNHMIKHLKETKDKLSFDAFHDTLTALPNRKKFFNALKRAIDSFSKDPQKKFAVLFVDLDRFKIVNDSLGHQTGDQLLKEISQRFQKFMRATDMIARLGGDEFVVLMTEVKDQNDAVKLSERIIEELQSPFTIDQQDIYITCSIGITLSDAKYATPDGYLRDSDNAMYRAKGMGKSRFQIFDPKMHAQVIATMQMEADIRNALERDEFLLHYQPIISLDDNRVISLEALIRWNHPQRGLVQPDEFIPLAEENGLILPIGKWVIKRACQQIREWKDQNIPVVPVSVNVSSPQFEPYHLTKFIREEISDAKIFPENLIIEITESVAMEDMVVSSQVLKILRLMGIKLSIDDFGTGHSSLNSLIHFPVDTLKIDQSFVREIEDSPKKAAIIQAIITLAQALDFKVIAEGVETQGQLDFLKQNHCDCIQGYLISRPLPADQIVSFILQSI